MKWLGIGCIILLAMAVAMTGVAQAAHFTISYSETMPFSMSSNLEDSLEGAYHDIQSYVGGVPDNVKIVVVSEDKMDKMGEHVEAFSAWNKKASAIVIREDTLKDKKELDVVLRHELRHLALNGILADKKGDDYEWMEEGICMVLSKEPLSDSRVAKYILEKGFLTPDGITSAVDSEDYPQAKNGYLQSFSLCKYIAGQFGPQTLVNIIKSRDPDFKRGFYYCTGVDFDSFYQDWKTNVARTVMSSSTPGNVYTVRMPF
jgi:hypothetical protein